MMRNVKGGRGWIELAFGWEEERRADVLPEAPKGKKLSLECHNKISCHGLLSWMGEEKEDGISYYW